MKNKFFYFIGAACMSALISCGPTPTEKMEKELQDFIDAHLAVVKPLSAQSAAKYFEASVTGKKEDYAKVEELSIELEKIYTSKEDFEKLKKIKESGLVKDEVLNRQLNKLYYSYIENQIDQQKLEEMIKISTGIESKFATFRAKVGEKELSDNDIEEVLSTSTSSEEVKAAWMASKEVGNVVAQDVIKVVKMRNQIAKDLGYSNYHQMQLIHGEQDAQEIERIFDELDNLTRDAFAELKAEIDEYLAKKFNITKEELRPWHYQDRFFQSAPAIYSLNLDKYYADKDIVELTKNYFAGINLPIDDVIERSDLFEKEGKNQHAYCINIDREGDVRVLCNVKPNEKWMGTMLHEYGHAAYDKFISDTIPYMLRRPAHTFTTEAIAMLLGRLSTNPEWLQDVIGISDEEKNAIAEESFKILRLQQLTFSRWVQVMYRFEKSMYENPDQDLNKLWWDMVEKYQMVTRPEGRDMPDWSTKSHIATSPCYYHNYMLGELLASQLNNKITKDVLKAEDINNQSFYKQTEVGDFLREKVFAPAGTRNWNDMIEGATGEKLTAKYYAKQFVN